MRHEPSDDPTGLLDRGIRAVAADDLERARTHFQRALDLFRAAGDRAAVDDVGAALSHLNGHGEP